MGPRSERRKESDGESRASRPRPQGGRGEREKGRRTLGKKWAQGHPILLKNSILSTKQDLLFGGRGAKMTGGRICA